MFPTRAYLAVPVALLALCLSTHTASAQTAIVSGYNMTADPGPSIPIPYSPGAPGWLFQAPLLFDPTAPPMTKVFESPFSPTGGPILLDSQQPFPLLVSEFYSLLGGLPGTPDGKPVSDWHERILTPGWAWVVPGDPTFPDLFPPGTSLITRDGEPWPSVPLPNPDPASVDVVFPPIVPGHVLDIHKALLWVGTDTQRIWGDDPGETGIIVVEYPTPEPSSFVLGAFGLAGLATWHWRRKRRTRG